MAIPWADLIERIQRGRLTPFLGAGISRPPLPDGVELANELAGQTQDGYPFLHCDDLMQVAQYTATLVDGSSPKVAVAGLLKQYDPPDFSDKTQPHRVLASLPIATYLTTNYDLYMEQALVKENRTPLTEVCRWNSELEFRRSYLSEKDPDIGSPVVYHIHGHVDDPDSMVLTEDDYLDFIVNVRRYEGAPVDAQVIPAKIYALLRSTSLVFVGYGLRDWNLRILLRALVERADKAARKVGVGVQIEPEEPLVTAVGKDRAIRYLEKYFEGLNIRVFWGTAQQFVDELKSRWDAGGRV